MKKQCFITLLTILFILLTFSLSQAYIIPVKLFAEVEGIRTYSGSSQVEPYSMFSMGEIVTGDFYFETTATDNYSTNEYLGFYPSGLTFFSVSIPSLGLNWQSNRGLAQIQNDCDYLGYPDIGSDRVRFASYPSYGLLGSTINNNQVLTVDIDVYEFQIVPPDPDHPLLTSDMPIEGFLLFDAGHLELQWYEGSNLISTYLDFKATPSVPIPAAAWLLGSGLIVLVGIRRTN